MKKSEFEEIELQLDSYKYSSMQYLEYEDATDYEIIWRKPELILLYGFNREADIKEYHWAANSAEDLVKEIKETECLITFVPHEWVKKLEEAGFYIRSAWQDYFMSSLEELSEDEEIVENLSPEECKSASDITLACRGQSRGFTGQTTEWFQEWLGQSGDYARNRTVFVERNQEKEIVGIVCTGTYGHDSEKGAIVWIREAAVRPDYQNQGIARKLILQALRYGKSHGAVRAFLAADECNSGAIHLYETLGFGAGTDQSQIDMIRGNYENRNRTFNYSEI